MKKIYSVITTLMLLFICGCSVPANEAAASNVSAQPSASAVVTFADPVMEAMVREAVGKPEGGLTVAEAEAVKSLNLNIEWQRFISGETPITDIGGLENFTSLESLDLSFHAVTDITPLAGLENLTFLSLGGNPVADISPLAGMTNLKGLILSGCAAQDYTPLANLANLKFLMLDNAAITDVSPLASLTGLKTLYLEGCPVTDYSTLAEIYPNLEKKDFLIPSTLSELGFTMGNGIPLASYSSDWADVAINHSEWGIPAMEAENDSVKLNLKLDNGYGLVVLYYPEINVYVMQMKYNNEMAMNYIYDPASGEFTIGSGDRKSTEQVVKNALGEAGSGDILLAPIPLFNDTIKSTFHMTPDALYALPFEPPTLKSLGFFPDAANAVCLYEQREGRDVNIEVHRPEWGEKEYDVRFFTPLSEEYRIVITYDIDERKYFAGIDDNDGGGANFELSADTQEHVDGWCGNGEMTVEEYFINAYNDPSIEDVYLHSVKLMQQFFIDTFSMTIEEVYALPTE